MRILGVTGGTGTGKSTVCELLKKEGAQVIDADKVARKMQTKGTEAFNEIAEHFGNEIIDENGEINRAALGKIIFNNTKERLILNKIVHKYVSKYIKEKVEEYRTENTNLVVLDVPIPIEDGFFDTVNSVWSVVANDDIRISRIMARMGVSEEEAQARINSQMTNREYEEIADTVILNEGTEKELEKLVKYELNRFMQGL